MKFSSIHRYEPDNWTTAGDIFTAQKNLTELQAKIEAGLFLIAEHWHYRGASGPHRLVIEDYDVFLDYLIDNAIAGDIIEVYDLSEAWSLKESILSGKCPDETGEIPENGAY